MGDTSCVAAQSEVMKFVHGGSHVPYWICGVYLVSNLTLNALNWYWFAKMIQTVRKRFEGNGKGKEAGGKGVGTRGVERRKSVVEEAADTLDTEVMSGPVTATTEQEAGEKAAMSSARDGGAEVGRRRKDI